VNSTQISMRLSTRNVAYAVSAAFDSVDAARVRAVAAPHGRPDQSVLSTSGTNALATPRKRREGNQHIFMIPAGAMGAGASGPSLRGCPV